MSLLYLHLLELFFIEINICPIELAPFLMLKKICMYLHLITIHIIIKLHLYTYIGHCLYIFFLY